MVHSHTIGSTDWLGPLRSIWNAATSVRDIWENEAAESAFRSKRLKSNDGGETLRLAFRNCTPLPLVLCWISEKGIPQHFYTLEPFRGLPQDPISRKDHVETSCVGHAFVMGHCEDVTKSKASKKLDTIFGGYRPMTPLQDELGLHLVTIMPSQPNVRRCCEPQPQQERRYIRLQITSAKLDPTPIDTSMKRMDHCIMGGWPVRLEPDCFNDDEKLRELYCAHIQHAASCLPEHARQKLMETTPIYINKSLEYGPAACPVNGRAMCFHPSPPTWLEQMGMSTEKCESIEIYKASEYWDDHDHWGPGGVFVHELSHAYHWKCLKDGYDNEQIMECYEQAMKEGLYQRVNVHGEQGPMAKAYACENCMEYFAELSTAFLGGLDGVEEYNKWYPFNRSQIKEYDPRAYKMLQEVWKVECEETD